MNSTNIFSIHIFHIYMGNHSMSAMKSAFAESGELAQLKPINCSQLMHWALGSIRRPPFTKSSKLTYCSVSTLFSDREQAISASEHYAHQARQLVEMDEPQMSSLITLLLLSQYAFQSGCGNKAYMYLCKSFTEF